MWYDEASRVAFQAPHPTSSLHLCCIRAVFYKYGSSMGFFFPAMRYFWAVLCLLILWTCVDPGGLLPWGNIPLLPWNTAVFFRISSFLSSMFLWCLGSFNPESFYFSVLFFFASPYVLSAQSQLLLAVLTGHFEVCRFLCLPAAWKIEFENSIQLFFLLSFCVCLISRRERKSSIISIIMVNECSLTMVKLLDYCLPA